MPEIVGEDNIREYLTAFADGELDADQILRVLDYLAEHPEDLELMRGQQRLRLVTDRAVRAATPPIPDALRSRIEALTIPRDPRMPTQWFRRHGWRLPAVAAALLVAGVLVGKTLRVSSPAPHSREVVEAPSPIPVATIAHATRVHADCSRLPEGLHAAGYPRELKRLEAVVATDLGESKGNPDLSKIGYEFVGAGPCGDPLADTVHLLYHSSNPNSHHTVSVFVQAFKSQFPLTPGTLYDVAGPRSPFPMYAWRTEHAVYFLIADDQQVIGQSQKLIFALAK